MIFMVRGWSRRRQPLELKGRELAQAGTPQSVIAIAIQRRCLSLAQSPRQQQRRPARGETGLRCRAAAGTVGGNSARPQVAARG